MSAEHTTRAVLFGLALMGGGLVLAAEKDMPDIEFLEYLGMWEDSDEDWMILDEVLVTESDERSDPVPKGEESTENEDES